MGVAAGLATWILLYISIATICTWVGPVHYSSTNSPNDTVSAFANAIDKNSSIFEPSVREYKPGETEINVLRVGFVSRRDFS